MNKQLLTKLCTAGLSQRAIADRLVVSQTTVRYWLGRYDLHTCVPKRYGCKSCGTSDPNSMMRNGRSGTLSLCRKCHSLRTLERSRANKQAYVDYLGGKCTQCGYDRCVAALEFHHTDPTVKDPSFRSMRYWGLEKAKAELDKCALLCANCHREAHDALHRS